MFYRTRATTAKHKHNLTLLLQFECYSQATAIIKIISLLTRKLYIYMGMLDDLSHLLGNYVLS